VNVTRLSWRLVNVARARQSVLGVAVVDEDQGKLSP